MKIVDFSSLDGLPDRDRLEAISLVGDGLDVGNSDGFGIAVADRLYSIENRRHAVTVRFAALLAIELGSIDNCLVGLPDDLDAWQSARAEYDAFHRVHQSSAGISAGEHDPLENLHRMKASLGGRAGVMIGRLGVAVHAPDLNGWVLSYSRFEAIAAVNDPLRLKPADLAAAPEFLDFSAEGFSEGDVDLLLRAHETILFDLPARVASSALLDVGAAYYLALLCLERARTTARHANDPQATVAASRNVIMPRR